MLEQESPVTAVYNRRQPEVIPDWVGAGEEIAVLVEEWAPTHTDLYFHDSRFA